MKINNSPPGTLIAAVPSLGREIVNRLLSLQPSVNNLQGLKDLYIISTIRIYYYLLKEKNIETFLREGIQKIITIALKGKICKLARQSWWIHWHCSPSERKAQRQFCNCLQNFFFFSLLYDGQHQIISIFKQYNRYQVKM